MKSNARAFWTLVPLALGLVASSGPAGAEFTQEFIEGQYNALAPAVCVVSFSSEITNPSSGEVTERNSRVPGLLVSADGLVMVRGHVKFQNAEPFNFKVRIGQGEDEREYDAVLLQKPDRVNVCFLRIEQKDAPRFPYVAFAKDVSLRVGEPVLLVGVLGQALDYTPNVSVRRVSAVLDKPRPTYCLDDAVPFGGVGGPVIDGQGRIVGVVGFDLSPAEGGDLYVRHGHPLIYPTDLFAEYIANPPTETGEVDGEDDAWLGVFTQPLSDDLAAYWGLEQDGGIVVSTLVEGGPGTDAGLRRGDVIVRFNDMPVNAKLDREVLGFTKMVRDAGAGARVPIRLLRDGKPMELSVTLAKRPTTAHDAGEFEDSVVGLTVRELTTDVRILLNLPEDVRGVIVRRVKSGSPAEMAGFRPGFIILNFGDHPVEDLAGFREAVDKVSEEKPAEVAVFCRVGPKTGFFRIQPRWDDDRTE